MTNQAVVEQRLLRDLVLSLLQSVRSLCPKAQLHIVRHDGKELIAAFQLTGRLSSNDLQLIEHYTNQLKLYNLIELNKFKIKRSDDEECTILQNMASSWKGVGASLSSGPKELFRLTEILGGSLKNTVIRAWRCHKQPVLHLFRTDRHHKSIGERLGLFTSSARACGSTFWYPLGLRLISRIKDYVRCNVIAKSYKEVITPVILPYALWIRSGHVSNYKKHMFSIPDSASQSNFVIKPMNCIGHICLYNRRARSFRDLPLRMAEFGACYRREASGALLGILRSQSFVQDDAHIICSKAQVYTEIVFLHKAIANAYNVFGLYVIKIRLAYPMRFNNSKPVRLLKTFLRSYNIPYEEIKGEGAFYGAKLEYHISDGAQTFWQCGTIQLDEVLPQRMGLCYINSNGRRSRPIIIHRAIFGSIERFIGILLEQRSSIPLWASAVLVVLLFVFKHYNHPSFHSILFKKKDLCCEEDNNNYSISYRVNKYSKRKVPYILVVGRTECRTATLSVRVRKSWCYRSFALESFLYLLWLRTSLPRSEEVI